MMEILNQPEEKRSYWGAYASVLVLMAILFIGWYFSEHGLEASSTANIKKPVIEETTVTYRLLW